MQAALASAYSEGVARSQSVDFTARYQVTHTHTASCHAYANASYYRDDDEDSYVYDAYCEACGSHIGDGSVSYGGSPDDAWNECASQVRGHWCGSVGDSRYNGYCPNRITCTLPATRYITDVDDLVLGDKITKIEVTIN